MQYKILKDHDSAILEMIVTRHIKDGWELAGNLVVVAPVIDGSVAPLYVQSVIKKPS